MTTFSHATTADDLPVLASPDTGAVRDAEEAEEIDESHLMDHAYDGIREYDNPLPSWWSIVFATTVAFSFLYFAYYNIARWGHTPAESYQIALAGWQANYKGPGGPSVTEEMLASGVQNSDVVARGADVFATRCVGCHAAEGRGQIGPNLTDLFQIHGSTRMDLYGTIVGGAPGTAMIAWGEVMKPAEIIAVATYVTSLRGKNLPGKEPQGQPVAAFTR